MTSDSFKLSLALEDTETDEAWDRLIEEEEAEEARKPPPVTGQWMIPLQDCAAGDTLYIWFRFRLVDDKLEIEACDLDLYSMIGNLPRWFVDTDLSEVVSFDDGLEFALAHGIAPGQPFLLEILPPKWERTSYEYDEWDCEYFWEVMKVMPLKAASAGARWQATLERIQYFRAEEQRKAELIKQQSHDPRRWKVSQEKRTSYLTGAFDGFTLYLNARVGDRHCPLAHGSGKDALKAFQALLLDFTRKYPQLNQYDVVSAGVKANLPEAIRFSQWDRLRYEVSVL